jgi:polysaccharide pyruvyl transferase WcaK-like protein
MKVAVTHAFSRRNAGDGLLVDLTLELLREAGVADDDVRVLALDATSFADLRPRHHVEQVPGEPVPRPSRALLRAAREVARTGARVLGRDKPGHVEALVDGAACVAVGGGYLVADSVVRSGGVLLNHLPQIVAAGRTRAPSLYLPQSIGPLRGPVGLAARKALAGVDVLYVRDDETFRELAGLTDVRRCPDLAVLQLAHAFATLPRHEGGGAVVVVPRALPRAPGHHDRLRALGHALAAAGIAPAWAVQADVDGPRSDAAFLGRLGVPSAGPLGAVLRAAEGTGRAGVVVSVRLHGAIASLLAGWPAIHLSYERKGWGAYEDLGLAEFVHDVRSFDVDRVVAQARALRDDPRALFDRVAARLPALHAARRDLLDELARRLCRPGPPATPDPR